MSETLAVDKLVYEVGQKPCPLCGGDKLVKHDTYAHLEKYNGGYGIQCTDCGCSASIKSWNNRTSEPVISSVMGGVVGKTDETRNTSCQVPPTPPSTDQPVQYTPDPAEAFRVINSLWMLLDDIDTASDMAKADDAWYRKRVEHLQKLRWSIYNIEDPGSICKTPSMRESGSRWQPMSTAPKDGSEILLATTLRWNKIALDKNEPRTGTGFYAAGAFWWDEKSHVWRNRLGQFITSPTHWMPTTEIEGQGAK